MKAFAHALLAAAFVAALGSGAAVAAGQQTFWSLSTGTPPAPMPTPTSYPVNWYGTLYYPLYWPVCNGPGWGRHCRPLHGHLWPPHVPAGRYPVPGAPKVVRPPR
jgi:hypothetical protein